MIEPLTLESEWKACLAHTLPWEPDASNLLIVSPHPDDETLGCGGLIASQAAKGVQVTVVAVTDGEAAYANQSGQAAVRKEEQQRALTCLGVGSESIRRLGLPDSRVASHESELAEMLCGLIDAHTHIVAPWVGDYHPDHEACGRAAEVAAVRTGSSLVSYFFWTWHRGCPTDVAGLPLRKFRLAQDLVRRKDEALRCHASQLAHPSGEPILPINLLDPMIRPYEVFIVA